MNYALLFTLSIILFTGCTQITKEESPIALADATKFQKYDKYSCNNVNMLVVERNVESGVEVILNRFNEPIFCNKETK